MANVYDEEQAQDVQNDLASREQAAAGSVGYSARQTASRNNSGGSKYGTPTTNDIQQKETEGNQNTAAFGTAKQNDRRNAGPADPGDKFSNMAKAKNFFNKHKKKILVGGGMGAGMLPILAFLMFLLGTLGLPNFFENMLAWRWAHLTRAQLKSTLTVMDQKIVYDTADQSARQAVHQRYGGLKRLYNGTVNVIQPNRLIQTLEAQDRLQYERDSSGRITKVHMTNQAGKTTTVTLERTKIITFENGRVQFRPLQMYRNNLDFWRQNRTALRETLKIDGHGPFATSRAVKSYLKTRLKVGWVGVKASKYKGKSNVEADRIMARDAYGFVNDSNGTAAAKSERINQAAQEADEATKKCVQSDACLDRVVKSKGDIPPEVTSTLDKNFNPEALDKLTAQVKAFGEGLVKFINPVYDIAVPVCMVYDGSKLSPEVSNSQSAEVQKSAVLVASTASQQKFGEDINAEAIGAMDRKLGDTYDTNVMRLAQGKTIDTNNTLGTQTPALGNMGDTTIFDVIFSGAPAVAGAFNGTADAICPGLTNLWVGIGLGVVNISVAVVGSILTGGASGTAQVTATAAAQGVARQALAKIATGMAEKFATRQATMKTLGTTGKFGVDLAKNTVKWGAATAAATYLAKIIVLQHSGYLHNGLGMDSTFSNDVDNGFEQLGDGIMANTFHGIAQTHAQSTENMAEDRKQVMLQNSQRSTFERYLALDNPNSLATRVAMTTTSNFNRTAFASALNSVANVFNPANAFSSLLSPLNGSAVAAQSVQTANYNNVQFDWSQAEYNKIDSSATYQPLENQLILEQSGKEQEISEKYGKCFSEPVGTLLAEGHIKRTASGDIKDEGLCSPSELSFNNKQYGDMVYRWRLSHFYETGLSILENVQNPDAAAAGATDVTAPTSNAGWTWPIGGKSVVTDCYGTRGGNHKGIDIAGSLGTPIVAASDGEVTRSGPASGYGPYFVIIKHSNGKGSSYGHMQASSVKVGDQVKGGQKIGELGNEGRSSGPHLHFNIFPGAYSGSDAPNENPLKYVKVPEGTPNPKNCSGN